MPPLREFDASPQAAVAGTTKAGDRFAFAGHPSAYAKAAARQAGGWPAKAKGFLGGLTGGSLAIAAERGDPRLISIALSGQAEYAAPTGLAAGKREEILGG